MTEFARGADVAVGPSPRSRQLRPPAGFPTSLAPPPNPGAQRRAADRSELASNADIAVGLKIQSQKVSTRLTTRKTFSPLRPVLSAHRARDVRSASGPVWSPRGSRASGDKGHAVASRMQTHTGGARERCQSVCIARHGS
jgi:hypothetical protein